MAAAPGELPAALRWFPLPVGRPDPRGRGRLQQQFKHRQLRRRFEQHRDAAASGSASAASTASAPAALAPFLLGKKATGTPVKIGLINNEGSSPVAEPSTGDAAVAAADYANDELGGIAGHPIQVDRCSENEDTASATACANKMVQDNVAAVVIGTTGFGNTMVPIITKAGIPYVSATGSSSAELTTPGTFMWTGGFPADLGGMAKYAASQGIKKVTAYVINTPSALAGAQAVGAPLFKAAGVGFTIEPVPFGVADATPQVTAGLAGKPGAAAIVADAGTCTSILKALTTVSPGLPTMGNTSCLNTSTLTALGSAMNGVKIIGRSDTESSDAEAQLFRYVMAKYYPKRQRERGRRHRLPGDARPGPRPVHADRRPDARHDHGRHQGGEERAPAGRRGAHLHLRRKGDGGPDVKLQRGRRGAHGPERQGNRPAGHQVGPRLT